MKKTMTNRMGLPQAIVNAVANDPYNSGDSDISVTRLIAPPYQRKLMTSDDIEIIEDVSERIWSLLGQATHTILERAYPCDLDDEAQLSIQMFKAKYGWLREYRLFTEEQGWKVSGQFDVIEGDVLMDYKVTSAWSVLSDGKLEWEQQLNLLRLLAIRNGLEVNRLCIVAILRDWTKNKARSDKDYPQAQVVVINVPVWEIDQASKYLASRVAAHMDDNPPPCTNEERWAKPDVWAVMKQGRKSAVKLHGSDESANEHLASLDDKHYLEHRPGEFTRCQGYCSVSHACPKYQGEVAF